MKLGQDSQIDARHHVLDRFSNIDLRGWDSVSDGLDLPIEYLRSSDRFFRKLYIPSGDLHKSDLLACVRIRYKKKHTQHGISVVRVYY